MAVSLKLRAAGRELAYRPFLAVLVGAVAIRLAIIVLYRPGIIFSVDSPRFARVVPGQTGLFDDYWMPAVYPAFLRIVRTVADPLWLTIALQHALGLALAVAVFLALRRATVAPAAATIAIVPLAFCGDVLFFEHALMADSLMLFFAGMACCAAVAGLVPKVDIRWLGAAGALAGMAAMTRSIGLVVIVLLALVAVCCAASGWRSRLLPAAGVTGGGLVIVALYLGVFTVANGRYSGISDMTGWNTYARVAQFADCTRFEPPRGTARFCDRRDTDDRPAPVTYYWFRPNVTPATAGPPGRFARAATEAQPLDYAGAVGADLLRYVIPSYGDKASGWTTHNARPDRNFISFDNASVFENGQLIPVKSSQEVAQLSAYYSGVTPHVRHGRALARYQELTRIDRWMALLLLLVVAGVVVARRELRIAIAVFAACSVGLFVLPTMTFTYDIRYGVPPTALMAVAAVVGAAALWERWQRRERET